MIKPIKPCMVPFGYKSILKTLFNEGKLPEVKVGIYGIPLSTKNVSIEHIIPKSKKGVSNLTNYALADVVKNNQRSSQDLLKFTTLDNIKVYLSQFQNIDLPNFNGKQYIESCAKTLKKLNIEV